ncbi:MAG: 50S ribosomal protein L23 [Proteobacteria bacterium]|nr:50S ribosomal protein L23 [Pseudomonadota bacterium]
MNDFRQVLKSPIVTEKATILKESDNVVSFVVSRNANKVEIKKAVEDVLKVKVENIRTINVAGKVKRTGQKMGKRSNWKKAYVSLKKGEMIDLFEGV